MNVQSNDSLSFAYLRAGPFISGTSHTVLRLGQRPTDFEDLTEELTGRVQAEGSRLLKKGAGNVGKRGRGSTLKDLIDSGLIKAGRDNITVTYKGITYTASLQKDGLIAYQGRKFSSATAFSIHCKRLQTPNKQGDDGWKSVLYEGTQLDVFRRKYQSTSKATPSVNDDAEEDDKDEMLVDDAVDNQQASAATDQWVQCDCCRTWRVVPPEYWPAVQEDEREDWLCKYALWDVEKYPPHKAACND